MIVKPVRPSSTRSNGSYGQRMVFDYSADGVRRSVEESLERLGLECLDVIFIHGPDDHWDVAIRVAHAARHPA